MPKPNPQPKKLPGKNPTDPMVLARLVVEATIGEPLTMKNNKKRTVSRKSK